MKDREKHLESAYRKLDAILERAKAGTPDAEQPACEEQAGRERNRPPVPTAEELQALAAEALPPGHPMPEPSGYTETRAEAIARTAAEIADEAAARARAAAHGGLMPLSTDPTPEGGWSQVRLALPNEAPPRPAELEEAEAAVNGLIAECRVLMREVAMQSARLSCQADERLRYIEAACRVAETGGRLAEHVVRLRGGALPVEETRKRVSIEYTHRVPSAEAGDLPLP